MLYVNESQHQECLKDSNGPFFNPNCVCPIDKPRCPPGTCVMKLRKKTFKKEKEKDDEVFGWYRQIDNVIELHPNVYDMELVESYQSKQFVIRFIGPDRENQSKPIPPRKRKIRKLEDICERHPKNKVKSINQHQHTSSNQHQQASSNQHQQASINHHQQASINQHQQASINQDEPVENKSNVNEKNIISDITYIPNESPSTDAVKPSDIAVNENRVQKNNGFENRGQKNYGFENLVKKNGGFKDAQDLSNWNMNIMESCSGTESKSNPHLLIVDCGEDLQRAFPDSKDVIEQIKMQEHVNNEIEPVKEGEECMGHKDKENATRTFSNSRIVTEELKESPYEFSTLDLADFPLSSNVKMNDDNLSDSDSYKSDIVVVDSDSSAQTLDSVYPVASNEALQSSDETVARGDENLELKSITNIVSIIKEAAEETIPNYMSTISPNLPKPLV